MFNEDGRKKSLTLHLCDTVRISKYDLRNNTVTEHTGFVTGFSITDNRRRDGEIQMTVQQGPDRGSILRFLIPTKVNIDRYGRRSGRIKQRPYIGAPTHIMKIEVLTRYHANRRSK